MLVNFAAAKKKDNETWTILRKLSETKSSRRKGRKMAPLKAEKTVAPPLTGLKARRSTMLDKGDVGH